MAITKILHMKAAGQSDPGAHLKNGIEYILNPEKTSNGKYVGSANCFASDAYNTMKRTKKEFGKTGSRQGYHFVISFSPEDDVDENKAFNIISEFVNEYIGNRYECVFAIHNDQAHIHGHIIFNSVSCFDGLKYHYQKGDWETYIQPITNKLCEKYGLPQIDIDEVRKKRADYKKAMISDIEECIDVAISFPEFLNLLKSKEYKVKVGNKYLSLTPPGKQRATRTGTLAEKYSLDNLRRYFENRMTDEKIVYQAEDEYVGRNQKKFSQKVDWKNIQYDVHDFYIKDPKVLKKYWIKEKQRRKKRTEADKNVWKYKKDIAKLEKSKEVMKYLQKMNISTVTELQNRKEFLTTTNAELTQQRIQVYKQRFPYKKVLEMYRELQELKPYASAYQNGADTYINEYERYAIVKKNIIDEGYTISQLEEVTTSIEKSLEIIKEKKKFIRKEVKLIEEIENDRIRTSERSEKQDERRV